VAPKIASPGPALSPVGSVALRPVAQPAAPVRLHRAEVKASVAKGLGAFLRYVEVSDEPVFKKGEFFGYAIARLSPPAAWDGIDLQPGDVVSRVNGKAIERPEQAYAAFQEAPAAKEIVVELERAGQPRTLRVPIED
jgi:type II secretory pathway component PulC